MDRVASVRITARAAVTTVVAIAGLWTMTTPADARGTAEVTVCAGGCTYTTLSAAVSAATSGEVIHARAGTYAGGFVISTPLTIEGDGAWRTVIRGGAANLGTVVAINANPVTIRGVAITGATSTGGPGLVGSGVITNGGAMLNLVDSDVWGNQAGTTGGGGGINSYGVTNVARSMIRDNTSGSSSNPGQGGGIHVGGSGVVNVRDTLVLHNSAGWGGGMDVDSGGAVVLADTAVVDNAAVHQGGGIDNNGGLSMTRSLLISNSAAQGGAIMDNGTVTAARSLIVFNAASAGLGAGGGVYVTAGSILTTTTSEVFRNTPDQIVRA